jgi:cytoskeleton protein RodZ
MDEEETTNASLFPERVGDRLRSARIKIGLDLNDIAIKTRVPLRHLEAIEAGDYAALPSITYCSGFVKAYARAVGEDEVVLARDLRSELGMEAAGSVKHVDYDAADPARVPPKSLMWTALGILALVAAAYGVWRSGILNRLTEGAASTEVTTDPVAPGTETTNGVAAAPVPAEGQVVLTVTDTVWLRIYDKADKTLKTGEMKPGESFAVPSNADTPMINTRLPHKIKITVAGKEIAPLATEEKRIKDVVLTAKALSANAATPTSATPGASSAPSAPKQ